MDDDLNVYDDLDDFDLHVNNDKVSIQKWLRHNDTCHDRDDSTSKFVHFYSFLSLDC